MKLPLYFIEKRVYGRVLYYPDCMVSRFMVSFLDRKCLDAERMQKIKEAKFFEVYISSF